MKNVKWIAGLWLWLAVLPILAQQPLVLQLPDTIVNSGDTLRLDITARQFNRIVSVQFSLNFDPKVIRYVSFEPTGLNFPGVGSTDAARGNLRFSWFDIQGTGQSLPDGSSIIRLKFFVNGQPGDATNVRLSGTPLAIQISRATNDPNRFEETTLMPRNGLVAVRGAFSAIFNVQNVRCFGNNDGSIAATLVGAPSNRSIRWTGPNNFQSQQEDIANLSPGNYRVEIRDGSGVLLLDSTLVIAQPASTLRVGDVTVTEASCGSTSGTATVSVTGGTAPYRYNIGRGFVSNNRFTNLAPGNYTLTVKDTNECQVTANFTITATNAPQLNLPDSVVICTGESVMLDAGVFSTYRWSNGATTRSISVNQPGVYSVTVSTDLDCSASDTIRVVSGATVQAAIRASATAICPGDSVRLVATGGDSYQWLDISRSLSAINIPNPIARPLGTSVYTVTVSNGCASAQATIRIEVFNVTARALGDTCIAPGGTAQLNATGGVEYFWFASRFPVSNPRIPNPTASPEDSTAYFVLITDVNGCQKIDTVIVQVANNPLDIKAINMITPNGDGKNDTLEFEGISKYGVNTLRVYNRWGDLIYNKVNYQSDNERFDGTYRGKLLPPGTYFYVLAFRDGEIKQTLTILRE